MIFENFTNYYMFLNYLNYQFHILFHFSINSNTIVNKIIHFYLICYYHYIILHLKNTIIDYIVLNFLQYNFKLHFFGFESPIPIFILSLYHTQSAAAFEFSPIRKFFQSFFSLILNCILSIWFHFHGEFAIWSIYHSVSAAI